MEALLASFLVASFPLVEDLPSFLSNVSSNYDPLQQNETNKIKNLQVASSPLVEDLSSFLVVAFPLAAFLIKKIIINRKITAKKDVIVFYNNPSTSEVLKNLVTDCIEWNEFCRDTVTTQSSQMITEPTRVVTAPPSLENISAEEQDSIGKFNQIMTALKQDGMLPREQAVRSCFRQLLGAQVIQQDPSKLQQLTNFLQQRVEKFFIVEDTEPHRLIWPRKADNPLEPDRWPGIDMKHPELFVYTQQDEESVLKWISSNPSIENIFSKFNRLDQVVTIRFLIEVQLRSGASTPLPPMLHTRRPADLVMLAFLSYQKSKNQTNRK